jgi:hypothetical protein
MRWQVEKWIAVHLQLIIHLGSSQSTRPPRFFIAIVNNLRDFCLQLPEFFIRREVIHRSSRDTDAIMKRVLGLTAQLETYGLI